MSNRKVPRKIYRSILKRKDRDELYDEKRDHFDITEVFSGILWWKKSEGWVVEALIVEGWSTAAVGGSLGYVVPAEISPILSTKFSAYRWIAENIQDYDDFYHHTT